MSKILQCGLAVVVYLSIGLNFCFSVWAVHNFKQTEVAIMEDSDQVYLVHKSWWGFQEEFEPIFWRYSPEYERAGWMTRDTLGQWHMRVRGAYSYEDF